MHTIRPSSKQESAEAPNLSKDQISFNFFLSISI
jgi:hypothetical protein